MSSDVEQVLVAGLALQVRRDALVRTLDATPPAAQDPLWEELEAVERDLAALTEDTLRRGCELQGITPQMAGESAEDVFLRGYVTQLEREAEWTRRQVAKESHPAVVRELRECLDLLHGELGELRGLMSGKDRGAA